MLQFRPQNEANKQNIHIRVKKKKNRTVESPCATIPHKRPPQRRIQGGPGGAPPPLFLEQTVARKTEKKFFGHRGPPSYLRVWMTAPPPTPLSQSLDPALHLSKTSKRFPVKLLQLEPFVNDHIS